MQKIQTDNLDDTLKMKAVSSNNPLSSQEINVVVFQLSYMDNCFVDEYCSYVAA